jgi:hypothetical protein
MSTEAATPGTPEFLVQFIHPEPLEYGVEPSEVARMQAE